MAWEKFNPNLASHDLVQDMKWNPELRREFKQNERAVLDRYDLTPVDAKRSKIAISAPSTTSGCIRYLGGQLSRFIWGNDAGKGAVEASNKLVASLQGHTRDIPKS